MAISRTLKGMHNLKTMYTRKKENESNYLKLYIHDKERTRLRTEQIRLNLRLKIINERLKEIDDFYQSVVGQKQTEDEKKESNPDNKEKGKQWKTMSIDY